MDNSCKTVNTTYLKTQPHHFQIGEMADPKTLFAINPNRGLGWMTLGASLHAILTRLKSQPQTYPRLDLAYSPEDPIEKPIVLTLAANGIRLRFDGADQRLRLVEIIDFSQSSFTFKAQELVRRTPSAGSSSESVAGPSFKHLYNRLFGPSYPGEYVPPSSGETHGTYVLSWPGLAARFHIKHKSWSEKADFVSLLSAAASPATSLAIFSGASWPEARASLYTKRPSQPRALALANKSHETTPDEVEEVVIHENGRLELFRRASIPLMIDLNETTPQDLIAELGPPDAIFRKTAGRLSINAAGISVKNRRPSLSPGLEPHLAETEQSSNRSYTDDSENELPAINESRDSEAGSEMFYNYFHHGMDVLVSSHSPGQDSRSSRFVATKVFLHGNVPGSYGFNRHRRSRWRIALDDNGQPLPLTSEMRFSEISATLKDVWHHHYADAEEEKRMQRGMVLNRGWGIGDSPESSIELLGGFEDQSAVKQSSSGALPNLNNTELFGFPGLLFEVLRDDTVSCLTVYQHEPQG